MVLKCQKNKSKILKSVKGAYHNIYSLFEIRILQHLRHWNHQIFKILVEGGEKDFSGHYLIVICPCRVCILTAWILLQVFLTLVEVGVADWL